MKYLVYIMSFMFVLAFVGCDKAKAQVPDAQEATTETVDEGKDIIKEHKCVEGKCCKSKCDGDKTKELKSGEDKCGGEKAQEEKKD
jgi:uncharacterized low-complexity protein